jgi:metallo-beta-lactamase class B
MRSLTSLAVAIAIVGCASGDTKSTGATFSADPPSECYSCPEWNQQRRPFHIFGNTYYVGMAGVSAVLIDGGSELALIDGGLPQSAAPILANIRSLGFDPEKISLILVSHAHFDHVGGVNAIQRYTGARVLASAPAAEALRRGDLLPDDPQFDQPRSNRSFPASGNVAVVGDREIQVFGNSQVKSIFTPGHTPGGMSWTWDSCENSRCVDVVYADSVGPVSVDTYRFSEGLGDEIARSAGIIADLDCDILLGTHPFAFGLQRKYEQGRQAFIDPQGCREYGETALQELRERLAAELVEQTS